MKSMRKKELGEDELMDEREIKEKMVVNKENVSLTDGRDQGQDGRQPKRMYHLRMVEIKARMVVNQRECITYGW